MPSRQIRICHQFFRRDEPLPEPVQAGGAAARYGFAPPGKVCSALWTTRRLSAPSAGLRHARLLPALSGVVGDGNWHIDRASAYLCSIARERKERYEGMPA